MFNGPIDPRTQALMTMGLGMLQGAGTGMTTAQGLGTSGLMGLNAYNQALERKFREKQIERAIEQEEKQLSMAEKAAQIQQRKMALEEQRVDMEQALRDKQAQQLDQYKQGFFGPGMASAAQSMGGQQFSPAQSMLMQGLANAPDIGTATQISRELAGTMPGLAKPAELVWAGNDQQGLQYPYRLGQGGKYEPVPELPGRKPSAGLSVNMPTQPVQTFGLDADPELDTPTIRALRESEAQINSLLSAGAPKAQIDNAVTGANRLREREEKLRKDAAAYSKIMVDDGLAELLMGFQQAKGAFDKYFSQGRDVPGVGGTQWAPNIFTSQEGVEVRKAMQGMLNLLVKNRTGAAMSIQEIKNIANEVGYNITDTGEITGVSKIATDKEIAAGLRGLQEKLKARLGAVSGGVDPEAIALFEARAKKSGMPVAGPSFVGQPAAKLIQMDNGEFVYQGD